MRLGIAVITCDRYDDLKNLVASVKKFTQHPSYELLVCNDTRRGHSSRKMAEDLQVTVIGDKNGGVVVNKNRALFYFLEVHKVDVLILLEDDLVITGPGWEEKWVQAATKYGHVNAAPPWWPMERMKSGSGTADDPFLCLDLTGQCTAVSAEAVGKVGYLDDAFKGYGYGHVEWTNRFINNGYGGVKGGYLCIRDPQLGYLARDSYNNSEECGKNRQIYTERLATPNNYVPRPAAIAEEPIYFVGKSVPLIMRPSLLDV